MPIEGAPLKTSPLIVEVIGLAGTGKSTLTQTLCQEKSQFTPGSHLDIRNARHLPYMIRHTVLSSPTILYRPEHGRWLTRREMAKVLYLSGWHRMLTRNGSTTSGSIIIDQGPIFDMAYLYSFGPEALRDPHHDAWWQNMFDRWARTIDMVIWLAAPMAVLIDRIRSREQKHPAKERPEHEMREYLLRYQSAFKYVLSELSAIHGLWVLKLDTGNNTQEEITAQARSAILSRQRALLREGPPGNN